MQAGSVGTSADLRSGDLRQIPWWRQPEDAVLATATSMLRELYRRDERGLTYERAPRDKLVLTCRHLAVLVASILKSMNIPTRVRSGHAPYLYDGLSIDHWINQYWDIDNERWVTINIDGCMSIRWNFDPFDMPDAVFDFAADVWLGLRRENYESSYFYNAGGVDGDIAAAWALFYDFHALMDQENIYSHTPASSVLKTLRT